MKTDINGKVTVSLTVVIVGAIVFGYLGYLIAGGFGAGVDVFTYLDNLSLILKNPFANYLNEYSPVGILGCIIGFEFFLLLKVTSQGNYMRGKEYGTGKYASPAYVNSLLADLNNDPSETHNLVVYSKKGKTKTVVNTHNRIITNNVKMSLDTRYTDLNNNILVIGGSGAGKTFRFVKPNILNCSSSFISTDPKGELMRSTAGFLKSKGYKIRVLNLLDEEGMKKSTRYNPFKYLKTDADVLKQSVNFMKNTKKKDAGNDQPFWDDSATALLNALSFYTWNEGVEINGKTHHDFKGVVHLLRKAEFKENAQTMAKEDSELDIIFNELEEREKQEKMLDPGRKDNQAIIYYNQVMRGAPDTVKSIIQTLNSRVGCLQNDTILDLLSDDEMDIPNIGEEKTAVFCVIPDTDTTFNFLIGMFYTQVFQILYHQADFVHNGKLPVHVTLMLDEFANVALPDDFCSLMSTMRSREISAIPIIQNMAQIKALFKDTWETIPGNCDTLIYLGGNEQSTHKYISEMLGKKTIDKSTSGVTKGKQGSSSQNFDVLGRELLLPEEVRKVDGKKCIVFIRGYDPIFDDKIQTTKHPFWGQLLEKEQNYEFDGRIERYERLRELGMDPSDSDTSSSIGKIYSDNELSLLKIRDKREEDKYKKELEITHKLRLPEPERPSKKVIELSLGELLNIPDDIEIDSYENIEDLNLNNDIINTSHEICDSIMDDYFSSMNSEENDISEDDFPVWSNEFETDEDKEESLANTKQHISPELKTKVYVKLKSNGFNEDQINAIKSILLYVQDDNLITNMFTVDMSSTEIKDYIQAFYS